MSRTIATIEPTTIQAGDSVEWNKTLSDFPASDWALTYYLIPRTPSAGSIPITPVVAAESGNDYEIRISAAETSQWMAGDYTLVGKVSDADERFEIYNGNLKVTEDLGVVASYDSRTYSQRLLERINKVIEEGVIRDVIEYSWGGMQIRIMSIKDALDARDRIQADVTEEQGGGKQRKILTRFRQYR